MAMRPKVLITKSTPHSLIYLLFHVLVFSTTLSLGGGVNVTDLLLPFTNLSHFNDLLTATGVSSDIAIRSSSLTLLAVPNSLLRPPPSNSPDLLRLHVITQYLSSADLRRLPSAGAVFPTLLPSTPVNVTTDPKTNAVTFRSPISNATLLDGAVRDLSPGKIRVLVIDALLLPPNFDDLAASESRPPPGLNITRALVDGHDFNVAASMLAASGVVSEFEADEAGAGITIFVPTDAAFADLPSSVFQSLPADKKATVLKSHVLHSYYPLGSLEDIVNPIYPTLATEQSVAGSFTVNITKVNGSVAINTGVVVATVTQTVFDQNPVSIFGVSKVLLPKEFFGSNPIQVSNNYTPPATVDVITAPALPPYGGPGGSHLTADPPGMNVRSIAMMGRIKFGFLRVLLNLCIGGGSLLL